jgi:hypothetical protein
MWSTYAKTAARAQSQLRRVRRRVVLRLVFGARPACQRRTDAWLPPLELIRPSRGPECARLRLIWRSVMAPPASRPWAGRVPGTDAADKLVATAPKRSKGCWAETRSPAAEGCLRLRRLRRPACPRSTVGTGFSARVEPPDRAWQVVPARPYRRLTRTWPLYRSVRRITSIAPSGDYESESPETAGECPQRPDGGNAGQESQLPPQQQPAPPAEVMRDTEWVSAAALERGPRRWAPR